MIQMQKIQSAKIIICLVLIFLYSYSITVKATTLQEEKASPFSVLEEDLYISNSNEIDIIKQPIIQGELKRCHSAKLRLLDYYTGISTYVTIAIGTEYKLSTESVISLQECKKDSKDILNPLNFAFISIRDSNKLIFKGWIFSKNTSISLPKVNDKYIYLNNCNCENISYNSDDCQ